MKKLTGNHKYDLALATILVLIGVIAVQYNPIHFPEQVEAYVASKSLEEITFDALLKKYTEEEYANMHGEAEMRATSRIFKETGIHAESLNPNK